MRTKLQRRLTTLTALAAGAVWLSCSETRGPIAPPQADINVFPADSNQGVIVLLADAHAEPRGFANDILAAYGGRLRFVFARGTKGFSAILPAAGVRALQNNPAVSYVGPIRVVMPLDHAHQSNPTWGLDRIDQRSRPLDTTYYYSGGASNVTAYIIDSGILTAHMEFGGRASLEFDATGGNGEDCSGHGTHVAGTVGGATYGVAKQIQLKAVRVLDCDPLTVDSLDYVLHGIDSILANLATPAVANLSLTAAVFINGVPHETTDVALDTKVNDLINAGVTAVVAAGNQNKTACGVSPARVASAITVGATLSTDAKTELYRVWWTVS